MKKYILYFMLYSIIGWCYEVFLEVVVYQWGFSNRGFLFGPYCPVYGFGALTFILALKSLKSKKIMFLNINITPMLVFLGIILISTLLELLVSYILEMFTGAWLWDYKLYRFNFQGRIALNPSIRFGIGGMLFMYGLQPLFEKLCNKIHEKKLQFTAIACFCIIFTDFMLKIIKI